MKISELRSILKMTNASMAEAVGCTERTMYLWQQKGKTFNDHWILKPYRIKLQELMETRVLNDPRD